MRKLIVLAGALALAGCASMPMQHPQTHIVQHHQAAPVAAPVVLPTPVAEPAKPATFRQRFYAGCKKHHICR